MKQILILTLFSILVSCGAPNPAQIQAKQKALELRKAKQADHLKRTKESENKINAYIQSEKQKQKISQLNNIKSTCRNFSSSFLKSFFNLSQVFLKSRQ